MRYLNIFIDIRNRYYIYLWDNYYSGNTIGEKEKGGLITTNLLHTFVHRNFIYQGDFFVDLSNECVLV